MKEKVIIIGGKGAAIVLAEQMIHAIKNFQAKYEFLGFCIDDPLLGKEIAGYPVLCTRAELAARYNQFPEVKYFFALYKPSCMEERVKLFQAMNLPREKFTNFIHPLAFVAQSVRMGIGNVVCSNVTINCNSRIGDFNTLNGNVLFGHDTNMRDYNILAGSATVSSEIEIGSGNFIGLNSTLRDRVKIGDFNIIGMASTVLKDIGDHTTVVGSPAKAINK